MVGIGALGRLRLAAPGLSGAQIKAMQILGEGGQALQDTPLHEFENGVFELRNDSTKPGLFLIGGAQRALDLELMVQTMARPDLAWDKASAKLLDLGSGGEGAANWLRSNPELQAVLATQANLRQAFPEQGEAVEAWARWALARTLLILRPASLTGWSKKTLEPKGGVAKAWTRTDVRGREKVYTRVRGPQTLWVETKGPGALDLELRGVVREGAGSPIISVYAQGVVAATLQAPSKTAKFACEAGALDRRCPIQVDESGWLGQAARTRVALMGPKKGRVRIDVRGGEALLSIRQDRLRPRLGKDPLRRAARRSCRNLRDALEQDSVQSTIAALSAGCVSSQAASNRSQKSALETLCVQALPEAKGWIAKALTELGEKAAAQRCEPRELGPGATSQVATLARRFVQLRSGSDAAWSPSLRANYLRDFAQGTRWTRLSPEPGTLDPQSWIVGRVPEKAASGQAWSPGRSWSAIDAGKRYRVQAPEQDQSSLSRLDLAWEQEKAPTRVLIDQQPQRLDAARGRGTWLLAPGSHDLQVEAASASKLFATIQPGVSALTGPSSSSAVIKMWPLRAQGAAVPFVLPKGAAGLPIQVSLRAKGKAPYNHTGTLWLRDDQGTKLRIALTGKKLETQDALGLQGQGAVSGPLRFEALVSPNATRLWIEGAPELEEQLVVSMRYRGPERAASAKPESETEGQMSSTDPLAAQGMQGVGATQDPSNAFVPDATRESALDETSSAGSSSQEIAHARHLLAQRQWGPLRNLFVDWATQPSKLLMEHRAERLALLNEYRGYLNENRGKYKITEQDGFPSVMPATFLAEDQKLSPELARAQLKSAANALETSSGHSSALWAAYRFSDALQHEPEKFKELWPLAYGLMHVPGYQIDNPRLNALRSRSAKYSRWEPLDFAYKSAGFEHLEHSGPAKAQESLASIFDHDAGAFTIAAAQTRTLYFDVAQEDAVRLSGVCRSAKLQTQLPSLSVSLDDVAAQVYELDKGEGLELAWSLPAGAHTVSVQASPQSHCLLRFQRKSAGQEAWTTLAMPKKQRWFATGPEQPLSFHAQGPGVLALRSRALGETSTPARLLVKRSSEQGSTQHSFGLSSVQDREYALVRDPELVVHAEDEHFVILPEDKVYLVELQAPEREVLVRAKIRVPDEAGSVKLVKQDWAKQLSNELAPPKVSAETLAPVPRYTSGTRRIFRPTSSAWGSFDLAAQSGIERDTQFETIQSRLVSGLTGTYRRELWRERLWFRGRALVQSQRLAAPMFAGQVQLSAQGKTVPMRARVGGQVGVQPLLGRLPVAGRVWVDLEASLRNGYRKSTAWDLRPSLRLDGHMVGVDAVVLGPKDDAQLLNSSIYRKYVVHHPIALKPKLVWTYRDLRNARIDLGSDLWLNADFKSIDRTRAWLRFAGVYRRSSQRPSWWIYQGGYRWTYAMVDAHRRSAYMRHALQGQLQFAWQWARKRRLHLTLADTLLFSDQGYAGNEIRLNVGLRFDPLEAFRHSAPQERRFLSEIARRDWKVVGLR